VSPVVEESGVDISGYRAYLERNKGKKTSQEEMKYRTEIKRKKRREKRRKKRREGKRRRREEGKREGRRGEER
jgi:hypothetical protein